MDFEFFEKLSQKEANASLQRFLEVESSNIKTMAKQCAGDGVQTDFSLKSIPPFMLWVLTKLTAIRQEPDPTVPDWIRNTESYSKRLFDFDGPSKTLILRAAYYLGESFVRNHKTLRWTVGNVDTAVGNMPVVTGFQHRLEMAPMLVAENMLRRVTADPEKLRDIERAVSRWDTFV